MLSASIALVSQTPLLLHQPLPAESGGGSRKCSGSERVLKIHPLLSGRQSKDTEDERQEDLATMTETQKPPEGAHEHDTQDRHDVLRRLVQTLRDSPSRADGGAPADAGGR